MSLIRQIIQQKKKKRNYNQKETESKESLGSSKTSPDSTQRMEDGGTKSKVNEKENDDNFLKYQRPSSKSDHEESPTVNSQTTKVV
ncbi:hypothetical protein CEXT_784581 [Caerostris extrusa]|uniref:Uncharacterized protein n=1 Tax=Caerostris extrusa TaxID=172846 RepID=A0AAV4R141_CAEEX|nr:hypothetical protein CEXT_784581 [Caerostris extrusa]